MNADERSPDFAALLCALCDGGVRFIVVGGLAGIIHGAARTTIDLDVVYERPPENLRRLAIALRPLHPYLRGAPPALPFTLDFDTLNAGLNFTLMTDAGALDLLGEIAGGDFGRLAPLAVEVVAFDRRFHCVSLVDLIRLKRAAGRPKDLEAIAELEALREEQGPGEAGG